MNGIETQYADSLGRLHADGDFTTESTMGHATMLTNGVSTLFHNSLTVSRVYFPGSIRKEVQFPDGVTYHDIWEEMQGYNNACSDFFSIRLF